MKGETSRSESPAYRLDSQDAELPAYATLEQASNPRAQGERVEHVVLMDEHQGKTQCSLKVSSHAPRSKSLPIFIEGEPVTGTVELDLREPDSIKAITVSFNGIIVYSAQVSETFLSLSSTLWQSSMGNPRSPASPTKFYKAKLSGSYSWPFSFTLPSEIHLSEKDAQGTELLLKRKLPPSLADRGWHAIINYEIAVDIKRNGFFQSDSKLTTLVGYCPTTRPDPPSHLRALAYRENTPLLGPNIDPEGWKVFPEVQLTGKLFKAVEASLSVSFALATPLAFARGTAIPCALILTSTNEQAVILLSAPEAPVVQMRRKLQCGIKEEWVGSAVKFADDDAIPFAKANWHSERELHEESGLFTCTLLGQLDLPHNLVPSFTFGKFDCKYAVDVYPPEATGFEPANKARLFRTEVTVTSLLPHGPRPRAYLPPGYHEPISAVSAKSVRKMFVESGFL